MAVVPILIVLLLQLLCTLLEVCGQQSPCYKYFAYIFDPAINQVIGQIQIPSPPNNVELYLKVTLSIAVALPTNYIGQLKVADSTEESVQKDQRDESLFYHVHFPLRQPIPLLTGIWFNHQQYCSGPPATGQDVTSIMLEHTLYPSSELPFSKDSYLSDNLPPSIKDEYVYKCGISNQSVNNYNNTNINPLVVMGLMTSPGQWPWLVALFIKINFVFQCAGSILTQKHVITAAHCFKLGGGQGNISASTMLVSLGRYRLHDWHQAGSVNREIASYTLHPDYNLQQGNADSDLAILTLREPVEFGPTIKPICTWYGSVDLDSVVDQIGYIVGWGKDENDNPYVQEPRMTKATIVSQETCLRSDQQFIRMTSHRTFCAGMRDGSGPCNGDSGSGLMLYDPSTGRYQLRGIVSRSLLDRHQMICDLTQYVVFVDVAKYLSWIHQQIST